MEGQDAIGQSLVLERLAQHAGPHHRKAIVGEADRPGVGQLGHLGQLLAALAAGDRGQEPGGDPSLRSGALAKRLEHRRRVDDGVRVRHREYLAVAAGRGGPGAGVDVLLVLPARRAQVHVGVDECRDRDEALGIHQLGAVWRLQRARRAQLRHLAVPDQKVGRCIERSPRVERARGADEHVSGLCGSRVVEPHAAHAGCGSPAAVSRANRDPVSGPPPVSSS